MEGGRKEGKWREEGKKGEREGRKDGGREERFFRRFRIIF